MVYKLAEEDKTCGVEYINWDKHYSPIPKATCEMLKGQCPSCSGDEDAVEITCEEVKKFLHGETEPPRVRGGVPQ
jgi:hypothetical protein|nr:MAG TPA: hypothetical protein [Caudoviricetes sp.]